MLAAGGVDLLSFSRLSSAFSALISSSALTAEGVSGIFFSMGFDEIGLADTTPTSVLAFAETVGGRVANATGGFSYASGYKRHFLDWA